MFCKIAFCLLIAFLIFLILNPLLTIKKRESFNSWSEGELRCISHGTRCQMGW